MRFRFGYVKWLVVLGVILIAAYTIILPHKSHELGEKLEINKDSHLQDKTNKHDIVPPWRLTQDKHKFEKILTHHKDIPRKVLPKHEEVLPRLTDSDKKILTQHKSDPDQVTVWAVLATENSWSLDLLLDSIQGFGVILLAQSVKTDSVDGILNKYKINPLISPFKCSTQQPGNNLANAGCRKNEWLWLMRHAWSLNPDVVCFTADDTVLHPDAKSYVMDNAPDVFNGLKFASGENASPWCFGPKIWSRLQKTWSEFCSSNQQTWEQVIGSMLGRKIPEIKNKAIYPSVDLSMSLKECRVSIRQGRSECSQEHLQRVFKEVATWRGLKLGAMETTVKPWIVPEKSKTTVTSTWLEHAQCMGNICEYFQMEPDRDGRVYSKYVQDGRGDTAYMIDLGPTCIDMSKILVAPGGEKVSDVMGRDEGIEFPRYEKGAFRVLKPPPTDSFPLYQKDVIRAVEVTSKMPEKFDYNGTTIAYTRGDYANVCFVVAELFNLYIALEHFPSNRMVWLDGHALGNLDDVPSKLFDIDVMRLGQLTGVKCFEDLVLLPKKSMLYYVPQRGTCDIQDFISKMLRKYNITSSDKKQDTVIVRDFYLAHPRATNKVSRKFSEQDIENIKKKLPNVKFVLFHEFTWREQLQIIANTRNLYAMHGAGLTLGLFLSKGSNVIEWTHPSRIGTLTFEHYMSWRPEVNFQRVTLQKWLESN